MGCTKLAMRASLEAVILELVRRRDNSLTIDWTLSTEDGQYEKWAGENSVLPSTVEH